MGIRHQILLAIFIASVFEFSANDCAAKSGSGENNLRIAKTALSDAMYPTAIEFAGKAFKSENLSIEQDRAALDIYFRAIENEGDAQKLLREVEAGKVKGRPVREPEIIAMWKARAYIGLGKYDSAVETLQKSGADKINAATGVSELNAEYPRTLAIAGKTDAALSAYAGMCDKSLTYVRPEEKNRIIFEYASLLAETGNKDKAISNLVEFISMPIDGLQEESLSYRDSGKLLLGELRMGSGDLAAAASCFSEIADATGANSDTRSLAMLGLFEVNIASNNFNAAGIAVSNAVVLAKSISVKSAAVSAQIRFYCDQNDPASAAASLETAEEANWVIIAPEALRMEIASAYVKAGGSTNYALAERELQKVIETSPDVETEAKAQAFRGEILKITGRPEAASIAFMRSAGLVSETKSRSEMLFKAAEAQMDAEQYEQACETYDKILVISSNTVENVESSGKAAFFKGKCLEMISPAAAEEWYKAVAKVYGGTEYGIYSVYRLARLLAVRKDFETARSFYYQVANSSIATEQLKAAAIVGQGLMSAKLYKFDEALEEFNKAVASGGEAGEQAEFLRAAALHNLGLESESLAASLAFLDVHPNSPWAPDITFWLGRYNFNNQEFEDSERYFTDFVKKWPSRPECAAAMLWTARSRFARREYEGAAAAALALINAYPESELVVEARLLHGESLCEQMRFDEAILVFDEICARYPDSPWKNDALGRKADSLFTLGNDNPVRYEESLAVYKQIMSDNVRLPLDSELQIAYKIGRCLEKTGRTEEAAKQYYESVILRYRNALEERYLPNEKAKAWLSRASLDLATLYEKKKQWRQAVSILRQMADESVPGREEAAERAAKISQFVTD